MFPAGILFNLMKQVYQNQIVLQVLNNTVNGIIAAVVFNIRII